jgi:hypothetical protein
MSRYSLVRALLPVVAAAVVWTTVSPAEARRPLRSDVFLEDWTYCQNGARLTIGANQEGVRLVVTSMTGFPLVRLPLTLREHRHWVWALNDFPTDPRVIVSDAPDTNPAQAQPDNVERELAPNEEPQPGETFTVTPQRLDYAATVRVWWRRPAGQTLNLGLSLVDGQPVFARFRVDKCVLLPRTWSEHFAAVQSWLGDLRSFFHGLR